MNSTITLYEKSKLLPERNFALDDQGSGKGVERYLSTLVSTRIEGFQYVKHALSVSIRVNLPQSHLSMGGNAKDVNYCKIQNGEETPMYYFVTAKRWKSENTIEMDLSLDTLNSFEYDADYEISEKTLVHREHQDRLAYVSGNVSKTISISPTDSEWEYFYTDVLTDSGVTIGNIDASESTGSGLVIETAQVTTIEGVTGIYLSGTHTPGSKIRLSVSYETMAAKRIIHKPSEDIQSPKRKTREATLNESYPYSWNLLYRNREIPSDANQHTNPVDCFLIPDSALTINAPTTDGIIDSTKIADGQFMIIFADYGQFLFNFNGVSYMAYNTVTDTRTSYNGYAIKNDGGTLKLYSGGASTNLIILGDTWKLIGSASSPITVPNRSSIKVRMMSYLPDWHEILTNALYAESAANATVTFSNDGTQTVMGLPSIDRTDPRNIKLIKLPYLPSNISVDAYGAVTLSAEWSFDSPSNLIKLIDPNVRFANDVKPRTDMSILYPLFADMGGVTPLTQRRQYFESKLFHSDFYSIKFAYDSFAKDFELERINPSHVLTGNPSTGRFEFTFVMSRNVVSKFLFDFTQYTSEYVEETQDYNHILCVARNNEEVLYNSQYLNYLRTGYNYDLKTKERTEMAAGVGIGLNVAGLAASIGLSFIPGAQAIGAASMVASGIGLASQLVSYAKMTAQNDQNIAQKLQEARMQGVSVQNADDVDLLDYYSGNKAKLCRYEVSVEMKQALFDLFHYCGYKTDLQKKPDKTTRWRFNFIQADLVLIDTANLNSSMEEDIVTKFKDGVTFLHYREDIGFDFEQKRENWESAIVPYITEEEE